MISMLGDAEGNGACGFAVLDARTFEVKGRWENGGPHRVEQTLELGEAGLVPLEVRWLHDPDADQGFVGAALSSTMWHFHRVNGSYSAEQVIAVEGVEQ